MADIVREIERKYEAADGHTLPDLNGVAGVEAVVDKGVDSLDATYYDTADRRLAADGITLRHRTGGSDAGWHLKLPVAPGVRDEIRAPLSAEPPRRLTTLVRSRIRDAALEPLVRIESERRVSHLLGAEGTLLAEVSSDSVTATRLGGGGRSARWTEIEVELGPGQEPAVLDAVEAKLTAAGLRPSDAPSKLARALLETEGKRKKTAKGGKAGKRDKKRATATPAPTAGDHVLAYVRAQVDALIELDPAARRDLPDSVHRMRVATRRMRSAFRSYRKVLDREATGPLAEELRWLAAELGVDRDREVLTERIHTRLDELPRTVVTGPVRGRLRTWSNARRQGSRRHLIAVLDSRRYLDLLAGLDGFLAAPPLRKAAAEPPEDVIPAAVVADYERLARRVRAALAAEPGQARDVAMHQARKSAKRTRYAAEAAGPALGKPAKRFARRMTDIQELLGDHQDSVVAREALRDIAAQAAAAGESAFTYGVLYGREEARADSRERELPGRWEDVSRPELRSALAP